MVPAAIRKVLTRQPTWTAEIRQHTNYIVREGSKDLNCHMLEGSRGAALVMLYTNLRLLGCRGDARWVDLSIDNAQYFASLIERQRDFELVIAPQLCVLPYRYEPGIINLMVKPANIEPLPRMCGITSSLMPSTGQ
nr:pyridoxal-dependent decarboxylase [Mycetohabitans sp. B4]